MGIAEANTNGALKVNRRLAMVLAGSTMVLAVALGSCRAKLNDKYHTLDTSIICSVLNPIEWIDSDSVKTKEQIITHNQVWDHYCKRSE